MEEEVRLQVAAVVERRTASFHACPLPWTEVHYFLNACLQYIWLPGQIIGLSSYLPGCV